MGGAAQKWFNLIVLRPLCLLQSFDCPLFLNLGRHQQWSRMGGRGLVLEQFMLFTNIVKMRQPGDTWEAHTVFPAWQRQYHKLSGDWRDLAAELPWQPGFSTSDAQCCSFFNELPFNLTVSNLSNGVALGMVSPACLEYLLSFPCKQLNS